MEPRLRSIQRALWFRPWLWVVVLLGSLFGAVGTLERGFALLHPSGASRPASGDVAWDELAVLVVTAFFFLMYMLYLHSLAEWQVFSKPVEETFSAGFLPLAVLLTAYCLTPLAIVWDPFHPWLYLLFATSYAFNAGTHCLELRKREPRERRFLIGVWLVVDAVSAMFLLAACVYELRGDKWLTAPILGGRSWKDGGTTWKDIIIALSAVAYSGARRLPGWFAQDGAVTRYKSLIDSSVITGVQGGRRLMEAARSLQSRGLIRVLDFGSANSKRSLDLFLDVMQLPGSKLQWLAHDTEAGYREPALDQRHRVHQLTFESEPHAARTFAQHAHVVIVTHALYDPKLTQSALEVIQGLPKDALVIVRGISPASVFAATFEFQSRGTWSPLAAHLWNTEFLSVLRAACGLEPFWRTAGAELDEWNADAFAGFLQHGYRAGENNEGLMGSLRGMYGDETARVFGIELAQLAALNRSLPSPAVAGGWHGELLPSVDLLYVFVKG